MLKNWTAERWIATGSLVFSVAYGIAGWNLPRFTMAAVVDAHVFPIFVACCQFALSLWLWVISGSEEPQQSPYAHLQLRPGLFLLLMAAVFIEILEPAGFIIATFLFLAVGPYILGWRKWIISIPLAVVLAVGIFLLFNNYLMVPLPEGIFSL
ncbi:MAG TPA: tripartite tricarboxylate transporter TctB family protein [Selenomonadales bacterium]|nr:tripartite tricarboxylate transporter TctB family protein [Selenomonadales bacterium]